MKHTKPLIYLASPYTHDDQIVRVKRFRQMSEILVRVINEQDTIIPFSPIVYTHPIDYHVNPDFDWVAWDLHYLARCDEMLIIKLDGWDTSDGIRKEINYCLEHSIPHHYANPDSVLETIKTIYSSTR